MSDKDTVEVVDSQGRFGTVAKRDLESGLRSGTIRLPTEDDYKAFKLRQETTTPAQKALAGAEGVGRALSFGASDWGAQKLGLTTSEMQKARKENNPNISATGEAVGYVAPLLIPGGAVGALGKAGKAIGAVPRAISRAGIAAEEAVAGRMALTGTEKLAARIVKSALPKAAGSAVEGAFIGGQQAVTEAALGDHELTASNVLGHIGTGALLGFGTGAALSSAGTLAGAGLRGLKGAAKKVLLGNRSLEDMAALEAFNALLPQKSILNHLSDQEKISMGRILREEGIVRGGDDVAAMARKAEASMDDVGQKIGALADSVDEIDSRIASGNKSAVKAWRQEVKNEIKKYRAEKAAFESRGLANSEYSEGADLAQRIKDISAKYPERNAFLGAKDNVFLEGGDLASAMARASKSATPIEAVEPEVFGAFKMPEKPVLEDRFAPTYKDVYNRIKTEVIDKLSSSPFDKALADRVKNELYNFADHYKRGDGRVGLKELFTDRVRLDKRINYESAKMPQFSEELNKVRNILADEFKKYGDAAGAAHGIDLSKELVDLQKRYEAAAIAHKAATNSANRQGASVGSGYGMYDRLAGIMGAGAGALSGSPATAMVLGAGMAQASKFAREKGRAYVSDALSAMAKIGKMEESVKAAKLAQLEKASNAFSTSLKKSVATFFQSDIKAGARLAPAWSKNDVDKEIDEVRKAVANTDFVTASIQRNTNLLSGVAPTVAMHMQVQAQNAAAFLANALPTDRNPARLLTPNAANVEPHYAASEVDRFMRYKRVLTNPKTVIEDMQNGHLSPDSVTALKAVYPTLYNQITQDAMEAVAASKHAIPYNKRVQLSILLGKALDPSLEPNNMQLLQSRFGGQGAKEPPKGGKPNNTILRAKSFSTPVMMDNLYPGKSKDKGM